MVFASAQRVRILLANPNSTESLTDACADLARKAASPGTIIARLSRDAAAVRPLSVVPVLEPVACGVQMAEALVRLGLAQSKAGKFAPPPRDLEQYE